MTVTPDARHAAAVEALERTGAALVDARQALLEESAAAPAPEEALVALCRAAYDALVAWDSTEQAPAAAPVPEGPSWRRPLDELRVQAALAEMELRDAGVPVHHLVSAVTAGVGAARHDLGGALDSLRSELRRARP